jgi:hypothetical protein
VQVCLHSPDSYQLRDDFWKLRRVLEPFFRAAFWGRSGRERSYYRFLLTKLAKTISFGIFAGLGRV